MSQPLEGTPSAANAIARVKYSHDGMIDMIIAEPMISQAELAKAFGYTQAWVSQVMNSDAFQARLALRKEELVDPVLTASIEEKMKAVASKSLEVVLERLSLVKDANLALKAFEVTSKAMGYGARQQQTTVQNNFVVALPSKAASEDAWMQEQRARVVSSQ